MKASIDEIYNKAKAMGKAILQEMHEEEEAEI